MYICMCKGITEKMLEKALSRGLKGAELLKSLGIGAECGACLLGASEKVAAAAAHRHKLKEK